MDWEKRFSIFSIIKDKDIKKTAKARLLLEVLRGLRSLLT